MYSLLGEKVGGVRVVPLSLKVNALFFVILLLSNLFSNFVNLTLNRREQQELLQGIFVRDLEVMLTLAADQREIANYTEDPMQALVTVKQRAEQDILGENGVSLGVTRSGTVLFITQTNLSGVDFGNMESMAVMNKTDDSIGGVVTFSFMDREYRGLFKYSNSWDAYFIRAEEIKETNRNSWKVFEQVGYIILAMSMFFGVLGMLLIGHRFRFLRVITKEIMHMQRQQAPNIINLDKAPSDDITYLGVAFNSLSATIQNLVSIFQRFATREVATKAYVEREVRLEGLKRTMAILFTDIRKFTAITETLGTDIIKLLNLHYDRTISVIHQEKGDIGSIIGDALLAMYSGEDDQIARACLNAIKSAYQIQHVTANLRKEMTDRKERLVRLHGGLTEPEKRIYSAVMLEVGVGIDCGDVFYGNIGSKDRMVNTAIGDNVNAAARLEGATKQYSVPILCSKIVRDNVLSVSDLFVFIEVDHVWVTGKTISQKLFWPLEVQYMDDITRGQLDRYAQGLQYYYAGDWTQAQQCFSEITLPVAEAMSRRLHHLKPPKNWSGIWQMTEK